MLLSLHAELRTSADATAIPTRLLHIATHVSHRVKTITSIGMIVLGLTRLSREIIIAQPAIVFFYHTYL